ncbi:MAG: hypothetical protein KC636_04825 [Myxococcales bacterium]|nr:hypothetical protein [Myxococcales bacterium]
MSTAKGTRRARRHRASALALALASTPGLAAASPLPAVHASTVAPTIETAAPGTAEAPASAEGDASPTTSTDASTGAAPSTAQQSDPDATATASAEPAAAAEAEGPSPGRQAQLDRPQRPRAGRGLLVAGDVFMALGFLGRVGLEVFWIAGAKLRPNEPFGRWSLSNVIFVSNWPNVFTATSLGLITAGSYRRGRAQYDLDGGAAHRETRAVHTRGLIILGVGLTSWLLTRALFIPVVNACHTNGCVYGYLESTHWATGALIFTGAAMSAQAGGYLRQRDRPRRVSLSVAPTLGQTYQGLTLTGAF